jgi:hypothetical protein
VQRAEQPVNVDPVDLSVDSEERGTGRHELADADQHLNDAIRARRFFN